MTSEIQRAKWKVEWFTIISRGEKPQWRDRLKDRDIYFFSEPEWEHIGSDSGFEISVQLTPTRTRLPAGASWPTPVMTKDREYVVVIEIQDRSMDNICRHAIYSHSTKENALEHFNALTKTETV